MQNDLPALRYPELTPQRAVTDMPVISSEMYQHVGRFAGSIVIAAFEQLGGMQRFVSWADDNYSDYAVKLFGKTIQRSQQVDHTGSVTLDDAISRLENQPLLADYTEVYDL
jgi:hypothetical protein